MSVYVCGELIDHLELSMHSFNRITDTAYAKASRLSIFDSEEIAKEWRHHLGVLRARVHGGAPAAVLSGCQSCLQSR
ncbi:hypothetical protein EVAR_71310_1 [Eumeta japonica]|uniref:Uncharacterized protein n=1 Tax=Eumeta variegata TaxID=151549 RepID=A0A4C2AF10_EUMVA|nr:hypothetical protein EVAR_71310_1 [Eumeta japonica]